MNLPSAIVLQKHRCGNCTTRDEENHCHTEIRDDYLLFALSESGDLNLRGHKDEAAKGGKEPLVDEKPFDR